MHHNIVAFDIRGFGRLDRDDPTRGALRERLYRHLRVALLYAGLAASEYSLKDTGDGVLALVRPHVSKLRLLSRLLPKMATEVREANARVAEREALHLRAVLHAGEVSHDETGAYGQEVNVAFRLLDSDELRDWLAASGAALAVIVSPTIYDGIVKLGYLDAGPEAFTQVEVKVKETRTRAWIWDPTSGQVARGRPSRVPANWEAINLPPRDNRFTGRHDALAAIGRALASQGERCSPVVLLGLAGSGKSQLALEYAHANAAEYDVIWVVRAEHRNTILADLAELARALGAAPGSHRDQAASLRHELARRDRWLLIFDNARRRKDLAEWLPSGGGHVVITTWSREVGAMGRPLKVEQFHPEDARDFLCLRTGSDDAGAAAKLADALGYLPFALELAAADINRTGITVGHYLQLFEEHREDLLYMAPGDDAVSMERTFRIAFGRVERQAPAAAQLAKLLAFLAPAPVRYDILRAGRSLPDPLGRVIGDEPAYLSQARAPLVEHSLVEPGLDGLRMHHLVQAWIRHRMAPGERRAWAEVAVSLMLASWPDNPQDPATWGICGRLLQHAVTSADHAEGLGVAPETTAALLLSLGIFHMEQAGPVTGPDDLTLARDQLERALTLLEASCEPDHRMALTLMHLGRARRRTGLGEDAKAALERAAGIYECAGGQHPGLADVRTHLGVTLHALGDHAGARTMLKQALELHEAAGGFPDGKDAWVLTHLARVLRRLGEHVAARDTLDRALTLIEQADRSCGHHVPAVLIEQGRVLRRLGDYDSASKALHRALTANEAVFGPRHHRTAEVLIHLGALLRDEGRFADAHGLLQRALEINVAAYGPKHHRTARTRTHLGRALRRMQRLPAARDALERALEDTRRARGEAHPQVASTLVHLSTVLQAQGGYDEARKRLEQARTIIEGISPADHPDVAWVLAHLSAVTILEHPRRLVGALALLDRARAITERAYGADHLDVAWVLQHVGTAFQQAGHLHEARGLLADALAIIERAVAPGSQPHRQIVPTLLALGRTLRDLGDDEAAARRLRDAYENASERLGPDHPETKAAWNELRRGAGPDAA